ncbi:MAG: 1-acyl-sn-glycerol-3-phosphate acyltransferase [Gammaproteobacteria bacterium]|nr:1-acyl-sn-glycerol-3-phosphate acyltransferase [Gammaproteobacteria bacterium]
MLFLRALLFYLGMWLFTVFVMGFGIFLLPFPFEVRYKFFRQWARFNLWWIKVICGISYKVKGIENIPAGNGIIFCKHQSTWETLALQNIFPPQIWLLKKELLFVPLFGWGLAMLEPIAIDRSRGTKALRQLISSGKKRLQRGRWVVIFPEGTRLLPGQKGKYHIGGALLAEKSGYPVVPVAHNAGEYWKHKHFIKIPGTINISVGPVIDTKGRKAHEINELAESWIEQEVQHLKE